MYAAAEGNTSKVAKLLSEGARVDTRERGFTALLAAADQGHTEVCELLLASGCDPEERIPDTLDTALHKAAIEGHQQIVQLLVSQKATVNAKDSIGFTPLHLACQEGHLACVVTLLQAGADAFQPNRDGVLPLHKAAQHNHFEVVKILINQGGCSPDQVGPIPRLYQQSNKTQSKLIKYI